MNFSILNNKEMSVMYRCGNEICNKLISLVGQYPAFTELPKTNTLELWCKFCRVISLHTLIREPKENE